MVRIFLFLSVTLFTSCTQKTQSENQPGLVQQPAANPVTPIKDDFKIGEVITTVPLRIDASQSFALYLPKGYSEAAKYPAIIFFDPHGDGTVPLNLYHALADQYGYVLIGSNTSKNGVSFDLTGAIANNLISEARTRFAIEETKISLCGFSGGAKVAMLCGAANPYITNIIYCGAKVDIKPTHPIVLFGFAGTKDMNYTDLVSFDWNLAKDSVSTKHYLIEWNGKHEFPTPEVFNDAFVFLKTGKVDNYEKKKVTITADKVNLEQGFKGKYIKAFQSQDLDWWKKEIAMLNSKKKSDIMYERLLGFLSLACYSIGSGQLQQNNLPFAEKILTIYNMADPGNKDCENFMAELKRRQKAGN